MIGLSDKITHMTVKIAVTREYENEKRHVHSNRLLLFLLQKKLTALSDIFFNFWRLCTCLFNLKVILFTICEASDLYRSLVRHNIGQAAMLSAILKPKSPENTTITYCRPTNHTMRKRHGTLTVA